MKKILIKNDEVSMMFYIHCPPLLEKAIEILRN